MSLPAMTFRERFCMLQQKGGIGGGGCTQRVQTAWLYLGSAVDMPTYEWHYQY